MIEVNRYYAADNADYQGIPTIEAWPPLTRNAISALMGSRITCLPEERTHSADLRIQYVHRLMDFFLPLDHQIDFVQKLWSLICTGYKTRARGSQPSTEAFDHVCASIAAGNIQPSDDAHFRDSIWTAFLVGTPGTGKTSSPLSLLRRLAPDLLHHLKIGDLYQCLYVHVQAPNKGRGRSLAELVFRKLFEEAKKVGLPMPYATGTKPKTQPEFQEAIRLLAEKLNLGVLILDELQHLYSGTRGMDQDAMKFLTGFITRLNFPVLFIGTWECAALVGLEVRLGRRITGPATASFRRMSNDSDFAVFVTTLLKHQFTEKTIEASPEIVDRIYFHTQGIQDLVVKLIVMCQVEAILNGDEEITLDLIDQIGSEHMSIIAPAVRMLREGAKEDDPDLWDLEPEDFEEYLAQFTASLKLAGRGARKESRARSAINANQAAAAVANSLEATGAVTEDEAKSLADAAVKASPSAAAADHVIAILQKSKASAQGPKPTRSRSEKKQAEVHARFAELDDNDIRKIVYLATREKSSIEAALEKAGNLCAILEDAPY